MSTRLGRDTYQFGGTIGFTRPSQLPVQSNRLFCQNVDCSNQMAFVLITCCLICTKCCLLCLSVACSVQYVELVTIPICLNVVCSNQMSLAPLNSTTCHMVSSNVPYFRQMSPAFAKCPLFLSNIPCFHKMSPAFVKYRLPPSSVIYIRQMSPAFIKCRLNSI